MSLLDDVFSVSLELTHGLRIQSRHRETLRRILARINDPTCTRIELNMHDLVINHDENTVKIQPVLVPDDLDTPDTFPLDELRARFAQYITIP